MSARILAISVAFLIAAAAFADTVAVYPLSSRDSFLGVLAADRIALSLEPEHEVYGPAVSPSLVPPLPIGEGFLNPTEFLQGRGVANRVGSKLLRDSLGADVVITGTISFEGDSLIALLYLTTEEGVRTFSLSEAADDPGRLVSRIVALVSARLGADIAGAQQAIDLSGHDGAVAQALALLAAGLVEDARRVLENSSADNSTADDSAESGERGAELLSAIEELESGGQNADPALLATLALNRQPLDERLALRYFRNLAQSSQLPAAQLWVAVLASSVNDIAGAEERFANLPSEYAYGQAAHAAFLLAGSGEGAEAPLQRALASDDSAALLGISAAAGGSGDVEVEKEALGKLGRVAPFFAYPFERLSFIAFDEDDALAAAEALAVAVELEPESDLYWTNLGWAYYLLGMLEKSEQASLQAVSLDPGQYIAQYNLGLVRAVDGRLTEANDAYRAALRSDPEVDDAAIEDIEQALELYPEQPALHYVLALLYESEGRRGEAASQFELYREAAAPSPFRERATERIEVLTAPPPPIELTDGLVGVRLGVRGLSAAPFHPGDPVYPRFEVYTPGDELPARLDVGVELLRADGESVLSVQHPLEIPSGAVAYVVNDLEVALPQDLQPGAYRLQVEVRASEDRSAAGTVMFEVEGEPQLLRQLLGRNLQMQALNTGTRLYSADDLARPDLLTASLLGELEASADAAQQALPQVETGRFEGMGGGEFFSSSTEEDVRDFLQYLLASGARDSSFVFVEAYAQWALEGAPSEPESAPGQPEGASGEPDGASEGPADSPGDPAGAPGERE